MTDVVKKMFEKMLADGGEFINIYYGDSVSEEQAANIGELVTSLAPDAEIITLPGGQPVYHYIFSIE